MNDAEREHRGADVVALDDVAGGLGALDQVVDERVDPRRAGLAEELDLRARQVVRREQPPADRVVDVVVDVGDPVDEPHDLPFERRRFLLARMREDAVAHLLGQVQLLGDPQRLLVVPEAGAELLAQARVELLLARMPERRVARVVPEPDRLGQILVQSQRARHDARDPGRLEGVRDPRPVVVAGRVDEDLRLALQASERLRVHDPVPVALERRPDPALLFLAQPSARLVGTDRQRRKQLLLGRANASLEGVGDSSGEVWHAPSVVAAQDCAGGGSSSDSCSRKSSCTSFQSPSCSRVINCSILGVITSR